MAFEMYGNANFNMESVLVQNVKASQYFLKSASQLGEWQELIDEAYYK